MLKVFTSLLALCLFGSLYAQNKPPLIEFGVISKEELEMTQHPLDTSAVAIVLFDYGRFSSKGSIRHTRIKVLKPGGLGYADVADVVQRGQSMKKLRGATYNLVDGRMVETKLEKTSVFNEEFNEYLDVVKFALEQVKVGSVIEYRYEMGPPQGYESFAISKTWRFQRKIPTVHSEFIFEKTMEAQYSKVFTGHHPLTIFEDKPDKFRWVMTNAPAVNVEPNSPAQSNFIAQARVALTDASFARNHYAAYNTSWERIGRLFLDANFAGDNVKNSRFLKEEAETVTAGKTKDIDKLASIYSYVTRTLSWNERESILTKVTRTTSEKRSLNSGEINLTLLAMLRYVNVKADPVLISTRENGFIHKGFPEISQFNRVIVQVFIDKQAILVDATNPMLPFEYLPVDCLNGEGFLVRGEDDMIWIEINSLAKQRSRLSVGADLALKENGDVSGKVNFVRTGYLAASSRKEHQVKGTEKYQKDVFSRSLAEIETGTVDGIQNVAEPLKESYSVSFPATADVMNNVIYLDPLMFVRPDPGMFALQERLYPLDFVYPTETVWQLTFKLPAGYNVEEVPEPRTAVIPDNGGRFMYSVVKKDQSIVVISQYTISRPSFTQAEYSALREFHKLVNAKHDEKIVLKKN